MIDKFLKKIKYTQKDFENELFKKDIDLNLLDTIKNELKLDLNGIEKQGDTLLNICIEKSLLKSAAWLIDNGADTEKKNRYGQDSLDTAIECSKAPIVNKILSLKVHNLERTDKDNRTLLQNAVMEGKNDIAKLLIDYGADVNHKDANGRNVIFDALSYGNEDFIDYLLEINGIELDNVDVEHNSVMHHHEVICNDKIAKKLIEKGADTTIKDKNGNTFLCKSALRGIEAYDIVSLALRNGADINSRVADENTILMEIISSCTKLSNEEKERRESLYAMARQIVFEGISVDAQNIDNETALFKAVKTKNVDLTAFLLDSGVDPNIQDKYFQSALHYAVYDGAESMDIILLLLRYGASALVKNEKRQTLYEILNGIVLHTHGNKSLDDKFVLSKIKQDGHYIIVLKELLNYSRSDLDFLDSNGNPLFFEPLLYNNFQLFKLYIRNGLNIHNVNKHGHNILFEYILKVFKDNEDNQEFQNNISMILSKKVDHNIQDKEGSTILHKVLATPCDKTLFNKLTDTILFNYELTDNLGRSVIHNTIWHDKPYQMKKIHEKNRKVVNIPDSYGILPITYAALLGSQPLVILLLELNSNVKSGLKISDSTIEQFKPMLKNLEKLKEHINDKNILTNIEKVIDQVKRDFRVL